MRLFSHGVIHHVENISQKEAGRMHSLTFNETKTKPFAIRHVGGWSFHLDDTTQKLE